VYSIGMGIPTKPRRLNLVGVAEIAELLGVSRQRVAQLASRQDFPRPVTVLAAGQIWQDREIRRWIKRARSPGSDETGIVEVPPPDPDRPQDDPWDAAVVRYALAMPGVAERWKRGMLVECWRRQPRQLRDRPARVAEAADLASRHKITLAPHADGKTIHFFRTDSGKPLYPSSDSQRRYLLRQDPRRH
jgi:predicted DNA-binding transcriptional regulator AlpA